MHGGTDCVAHVFANDAVSGRLSNVLHRATNFVQSITNGELFDPGPHGTLGHFNESLGLIRDFPDSRGVGRVTVIALNDGATVNGDDVTLFEDVVTRNPVDNHVIGARANNRREPVIIQEV